MRENSVRWIAFLAPVFLLPLAGAATAGKPLGFYLHFPPKTPVVAHPPFSWPIFTALSLFIVAAVAPLLFRFLLRENGALKRPPVRTFPWWGWAGAGLGVLSWVIAWNRFPWMGELQAHTFTPLWLSFILVFNGLLHRKTGRDLLSSRARGFLLLFPASALFWWSFEYLNRFVGNWRYVGGREFSAPEYILFATLPFSTVLPAVLSVREWILASPRFDAAFRRWRPFRPSRPRTLAAAALLLSCAGLFAVGIVPDAVYPLVWVAPPLLLLSFSAVRGERQPLSDIAEGDWREFAASCFAALLCGFFWEMWNFGSAMKWVYDIPYVDAFRIFEMPILGYAGYLPFGMLCAEVGDRILGRERA